MKQLTLLILLFVNSLGYSADFGVENDRLYISGFLDHKEERDFLQNLDKYPKVKTIVFEKCLGGDAQAVFVFAKIISERNLDTSVKGQCHSACAFAFLAGKRRSFDNGYQTNGMLFHMSRPTGSKDSQKESEVDIKLEALLNKFTKGKISNSIMLMIRNSNSEAAGVLFTSRNYFLFTSYKTMYCDGSQGADASKCMELENADPLLLGITTSE